MLIIILVVLILMNGVGYQSAPVGGYRYGYGGLGFLLLVILILYVLHIIPATL
jgi:hypothetical protein